MKVLLVDDDDFNHMVMSDNFRAPDFKLEVAINGRMAIERAQTSHPDLIIMDIEMPVMGGSRRCWRFVHSNRSRDKKPSFIVAYSGHDDERRSTRLLRTRDLMRVWASLAVKPSWPMCSNRHATKRQSCNKRLLHNCSERPKFELRSAPVLEHSDERTSQQTQNSVA